MERHVWHNVVFCTCMHSYKYKHMLLILQRTKYSGEQLNSLSTLNVSTSVGLLWWARWATATYGRMGKLKTRVRKRILSNKCFPTLD